MTDRTDNFNRADTTNNIGTPSDGGSAWVQQSGTWGISGNTAYVSSGTPSGFDPCTLESSVADADVQVTGTGGFGSAGDTQGVCARFADTSNYLMWIWTSGTGLRMFKNVAGSLTQLGSTVSYSAVSGDVMKLSVSGSTLNGYVNGTLKVGPITDSAGSTNTKHGMIDFSTPIGTFDDFSITGTGGGGPIPKPSTLAMMGVG